MGLTEGARAVLLEMLQARDAAGVVDDTSWERNEWAAAVTRMTITAFETAREVRAEVGRTRGATPGRFGTPWAKIPVLMERAQASAMKAWEAGDRLEFAAALLVQAAQLLLAVEELPIWMPPEEGMAAETQAVREFIATLATRSPVRPDVN